MAIQFVDKRPAKRITKAAEDSAAISKGEEAAARITSKEPFDRVAYQREYMRKRRAAQKEKRDDIG